MLAMQPPSVAQEYRYLVELALELGKSGYDYAVEFQVGWTCSWTASTSSGPNGGRQPANSTG
jgi:hypothetical protein